MRKDFEKLYQAFEELLKLSEGKMLLEYAAALENLRTMIRKIYDKHETGGKVSMIEMGKYDRLHKMEQEIEKNLKQLYQKNVRLMDETLKNIFVLTREQTLQSIAKAFPEKKDPLLSIAKKLDIDATVNEKMAGLHWAERMGKHRSDVIYNVNKTLKEGLAKGSTYKEMSDRLKKELGDNALQPMRILRTEGGRVYARTQKESLDKVSDAGIKMVKTWKSSKDERVRSQHRAMEGVTIPYEEEFTLPDGTKTKAPRLSGAPQHDIHCRCFITIDLAESLAAKSIDNPSLDEVKYNKDYDYTVSIDGYSEQVNQGLSQAIEEVAKRGSQDGFEHMILVDLSTGENFFYECNQSKESVGYLFREKIEEHSEKRFAFVHNHNVKSALSIDDMRTLLENRNIDIMVGAQNNAVIYIAQKTKEKIKVPYFLEDWYPDVPKEIEKIFTEDMAYFEKMKLIEEEYVHRLAKDYCKNGKVERLDGRK